MRVSLAVHKRQNQAREQGKAEKDDRNDLNRFFVAAFYQNINQKDTIQTGHNKGEKTERPAMKNVCVVDAEHGVYKDGTEVNERKDNRGNENKGEVLLTIMSSLAQEESRSISENCTWGQRKRFADGKVTVPFKRFLGYDRGEDGNLVINPEQAEVVRWMFAQVLSGKGTQAVADALNEKGVPSKKGGRWTATTVRGMLANEKYTGDVIFQKTYTDSQFNRHVNRGEKDRYALSDHHEAIISREDFDAVRALIHQRGREKGIDKGSGKYQNRYCFSGKIICGECGGSFKRRIHSCSGNKYAAWCCNTHINDKSHCSMKYVEDEVLKAAFITMMNKLIYAHRMILKPYVEALRSENKDGSLRRIQQIQTLLLQNSDQRETLTKLMGQGYIDPIIYNEENNALLRQADDYRAEIEMLNKNISGDASHLQAATTLLHFAGKSAMLDTFDEELFEQTVDRIIVQSRSEFVFELKCGLKLKERM